jgi:CheY-like chemotaxis protein
MASVLIIEDDETIQALLERMLRIDGYEVRCANNGIDGLQEVEAIRPDLIILDMGLPLMDGETFLLNYHQTPPPYTPVIGISGYPVESLATAGLAAFLTKPFDFGQLRRTLDAVLTDYASA